MLNYSFCNNNEHTWEFNQDSRYSEVSISTHSAEFSKVLMSDRLLLSLQCLTLKNSRHRQVKASINYSSSGTKVNIRIWVLVVELH